MNLLLQNNFYSSVFFKNFSNTFILTESARVLKVFWKTAGIRIA
ncbi:hypothetical protein B4098_2416 [Heyndrickxia coagulans]|uniref:Uncharacterized protein n=1 Tax=Heyndrickxia coagulans TaxID=1398 RepID=A0A150JPL0_HEYCO|nr:hypothetical protein B4098_2416 [Heyndrickxia coagulans]